MWANDGQSGSCAADNRLELVHETFYSVLSADKTGKFALIIVEAWKDGREIGHADVLG